MVLRPRFPRCDPLLRNILRCIPRLLPQIVVHFRRLSSLRLGKMVFFPRVLQTSQYVPISSANRRYSHQNVLLVLAGVWVGFFVVLFVVAPTDLLVL